MRRGSRASPRAADPDRSRPVIAFKSAQVPKGTSMIGTVDANASAALTVLAAFGAGAIVVGLLLLVYLLAPHPRASTRLPQLDLEALESHVRHEVYPKPIVARHPIDRSPIEPDGGDR